jgi:hypothetical protein
MHGGKTDYAHDVFFSYKRHSLTLEWTRRVHRQLQFWLTQELGRDAGIFVDEDSIDIGDRWPERLKKGLLLSRCMVSVWSPSYFSSAWCMSEWRSFRQREEHLGLQSHGLIAPMRFGDGEHFPDEARQVQWLDVGPFTSLLPAFWTSHRALELEDRLKGLAKSVAKIVNGAPPFENWPIVEAPAWPWGRLSWLSYDRSERRR